MKQKRNIFFAAATLTAVLSLAAGFSVQAAELSRPAAGGTEEAVSFAPASEVTETFYGSSYNKFWSNLTCECKLESVYGSSTSIHAMTTYDGSNTMVAIHSTAYNANNAPIGSNGNAANGTVATSYNTTDSVYYSYQKHEALEKGLTVNAILYQY